jgi:hypothetical protein
VKTLFVRIAAVGVVVAAGAAAIALPRAAAQVQVTPSYIPIGVAASGNSSTAWFHQPSSGGVLACQAIPAASSQMAGSIQCVSAKLP